MEAVVKCLNILSTTMLVVASIYATTMFPWIATESMDIAVGFVIILNATASPKEKI